MGRIEEDAACSFAVVAVEGRRVDPSAKPNPRRLLSLSWFSMADPLITDEELAALLTSPESAQDDAGSMKMRPLGDILKAIEFKEKRTPVNPHAVLKGLAAIAVTGPQGGCP